MRCGRRAEIVREAYDSSAEPATSLGFRVRVVRPGRAGPAQIALAVQASTDVRQMTRAFTLRRLRRLALRDNHSTAHARLRGCRERLGR
jgi:hypothetical protein